MKDGASITRMSGLYSFFWKGHSPQPLTSPTETITCSVVRYVVAVAGLLNALKTLPVEFQFAKLDDAELPRLV
jgi:hypothetical protein